MRLAFAFRIAPDAFAAGAPPFDFLTLGFEGTVCDAGGRRRGLSLTMTGNNSSLARGLGADCIDAGAPDDFYTTELGAALASLKGVWVRAVLLLQRGTNCTGGAAPGASHHVALNAVEKACFDLTIDPFAHLRNAYFGLGLAAGGRRGAGLGNVRRRRVRRRLGSDSRQDASPRGTVHLAEHDYLPCTLRRFSVPRWQRLRNIRQRSETCPKLAESQRIAIGLGAGLRAAW